jgi:hypothetical protein
MTRLGRVCAAAALSVWAAAASAATLFVGPDLPLPQALRQAADGDEIDIPAGDYRGQVGVILQRRLTLRGVGGRPVLHADGRSAEGKAILVVRDGDVRIENLEFRGARVPDRNGAGIRFEGGRLQVLRCAFFDNENGILTGGSDRAELVVEDSEFGAAPAGTPLPHLMYVGRIAHFTLRGSRVGGGQQGHLVKSRALRNHVLFNRLVDGLEGHAAYELEFPNGGLAWVIGNVIAQSAGTSNPAVVSFLAEGRSDAREHGLFMAHNTLVSEGSRPAQFVAVREGGVAVPRQFFNNLSVGVGVADAVLADAARGNFAVAAGALRDAAAGDFGLSAPSPLRGRGVEPGSAHGESLRLTAEFTPPAGTHVLAAPARWSPGALQD